MRQYLLLIAAIVITGCYSRGNSSSTGTKVIDEVVQETPEQRAANEWASYFDNSGFRLFTTGLCSTIGLNRSPIILVFHSYSYSIHCDEGVATLAYWADNPIFGTNSLHCPSRYKYKFHNYLITLYDGEFRNTGRWQANPYSPGEDGTLNWDSQTNSIDGQLLEYRNIRNIHGSEYEYDITPWVNII